MASVKIQARVRGNASREKSKREASLEKRVTDFIKNKREPERKKLEQRVRQNPNKEKLLPTRSFLKKVHGSDAS